MAIQSVVENHLWPLMSLTPFLRLPKRFVKSTCSRLRSKSFRSELKWEGKRTCSKAQSISTSSVPSEGPVISKHNLHQKNLGFVTGCVQGQQRTSTNSILCEGHIASRHTMCDLIPLAAAALPCKPRLINLTSMHSHASPG